MSLVPPSASQSPCCGLEWALARYGRRPQARSSLLRVSRTWREGRASEGRIIRAFGIESKETRKLERSIERLANLGESSGSVSKLGPIRRLNRKVWRVLDIFKHPLQVSIDLFGLFHWGSRYFVNPSQIVHKVWIGSKCLLTMSVRISNPLTSIQRLPHQSYLPDPQTKMASRRLRK